MTIADIQNFAYFRTNSDSTIYPVTDQLISINRWLHKVWSMILDSMDGWDLDDASRLDYAIITTPMIAGQRDYTLPASLKLLKIKRVDITYDGSQYNRAVPVDTAEFTFGLGNNTNTDAEFSTSSPNYDLIANSIRVYPLANVAQIAAGAKIRVEYLREMIEVSSSDITAGTLTPPVDEPFHMMLALGLSYDYSTAKSQAQKTDLQVELVEYEARLRRQYGKKDLDTADRLIPEFINYT